MKSQQLANVLIKVAGLYICLHAIPNFVSSIIIALAVPFAGVKNYEAWNVLSYGIASGVQAAVGLLIIAKSRKIAAFWFRHEEE